MGVLRRLWGGYLRQLERRPIVVKATSSAITFSLTDTLVSNDARASIVFLPLSAATEAAVSAPSIAAPAAAACSIRIMLALTLSLRTDASGSGQGDIHRAARRSGDV